MIINVKHRKNTITVDVRCHQIRYLRNPDKLTFIDISHTDSEAYEFLYHNNQPSFLNCLAEDVTNNSRISVRAQDLELLP